MNRTGITRAAGQSGIQGVRLVRVGGIVIWIKRRYQSDRLIPYVSREVLIEDTIDKLIISKSGFDAKNRLLHGEWICTIFE